MKNKYMATTYETERGIFPTRLRKLMACNPRNNKRTTQKDLADKLGVERQTISNYCRGQSAPNIDKVIEIADYFGVPIDYLFGRGSDSYFLPSYKSDIFREVLTGRGGTRFYKLCLKIMDLTDGGISKVNGYVSDLLEIKKYNEKWLEYDANSKDRD